MNESNAILTTNPLLDATGVVKTYGAVVALRNASLSVLPGEVHALMAGALIGSLPVVILYSFFVEHYVSSMTGAVKE